MRGGVKALSHHPLKFPRQQRTYGVISKTFLHKSVNTLDIRKIRYNINIFNDPSCRGSLESKRSAELLQENLLNEEQQRYEYG
jgi:hypothetical protein